MNIKKGRENWRKLGEFASRDIIPRRTWIPLTRPILARFLRFRAKHQSAQLAYKDVRASVLSTNRTVSYSSWMQRVK